jgi:transposase
MGGVFDRPLHGLVLTEAEFETDEQAYSRRWPGLRSSPRSPVFPATRGVPGNTAGLPPLAVILTPGQAGDNPELLPLLDDIHDINVDGQRVRVGRVIADKAYAHPSTRSALRRRRIKATIPERVDQMAHRKARGSAGGSPPAFAPDLYKLCHVVERCFNRLKQIRGLATRFVLDRGVRPPLPIGLRPRRWSGRSRSSRGRSRRKQRPRRSPPACRDGRAGCFRPLPGTPRHP